MPVKIRLMRIGAKKRPFYRVVAVDERKKRTGGYIELLGTYNPLTKPKEISLKQDLIDKWVKNGAVLSDGFLRIIGKAPQRPPRKPKKEKIAKTMPPVAEESPAEEPNTPVEKVAPESVEQAPDLAESQKTVEAETPTTDDSEAAAEAEAAAESAPEAKSETEPEIAIKADDIVPEPEQNKK